MKGRLQRHAARIGGNAARILPQARLSGPMPWVIAIMTALTVIALAGGLALANLADNARTEIAGGLTVQVIEAEPQARDRQAENALAMLNNRQDVAEVRRVPEEELAALIEPWRRQRQHECDPDPGLDRLAAARRGDA